MSFIFLITNILLTIRSRSSSTFEIMDEKEEKASSIEIKNNELSILLELNESGISIYLEPYRKNYSSINMIKHQKQLSNHHQWKSISSLSELLANFRMTYCQKLKNIGTQCVNTLSPSMIFVSLFQFFYETLKP